MSWYGTGIAYIITTAISMRCFFKVKFPALSLLERVGFPIILWLIVAHVGDSGCSSVIMSFSYSSIGFALGLAKVIGNRMIKGNIVRVPQSTSTEILWKVSQALGDIAFAYPYSIILIEIQDTLKSQLPENKTMKKASMIAIFITTFFYLFCGCFGYAAFGNNTPGNILKGFGFYEPYWLIDFANACIVLHLVGGYQMFSLTVFVIVEKWIAQKYPSSGFVNNLYTVQIPCLPPYQINLLRICFRTAYVVSTTGIAMLFPYFNPVLGVLGALNFWPLAIYFPVEMYSVQRKIGPWTRKCVVLQTFGLV
ncbi:probable amino acid permease 7 [Magnolia sinica]|uniref:probable amino acid permease 7 n=1 Tax=Magnolia sinica TaxID=86752 RepID=UPI00265818EB|nr:probable amino acid permease 7 [Magnolia sinica]